MTRGGPLLRGILVVFAIALAVAGTLLVRAPAAWIGDWLEAHGRLRLIDPRGTLWDGSGMLALSDGERALLLPGRLAWRVDRTALLVGRLEATLAHPVLGAAVVAKLGPAATSLSAGRAEVPAALLAALGAPFSTIRPGGVLALRWSDLQLRGGGLAGGVEVDWRDAQSALSFVAPLGSYRVKLSASGAEAASVQLDTVRGPLRLQGSGTLKGGHLSFKGLATADPEMRHMLNGLLGVLGRRSGDNVMLALET